MKRCLFVLWLAALASSPPAFAADPRRSGFEFMGPSTQAMQKDDAMNPGMLWVKDGEAVWQQPAGQSGKVRVACHASAASSMRGVSARYTGYPVYRLEWQAMGSLQRRLRNCMRGVRAEPFAYGAQELVELEIYLAVRAKGMLVEAPGVRP